MRGREPGRDWLADRRTEVAAERILDAADELFTEQDPSSVGMNEIATAAGCSRATLYRYFENREALYGAYVHREAQTLNHRLTESLAGIDHPRERLITGITQSIALVRGNPALASWFATTGPLGGEFAERSEVITAMVAGFLRQLRHPDTATTTTTATTEATVERHARWVVRVLTSLLIFPGRDTAEETAMLAEFVAPIVLPAGGSAAPR